MAFGLIAVLAVATLVVTAHQFGRTNAVATGGPFVADPSVTDGAVARPDGQVVQLRGIGRSGSEYECMSGHGVFYGPVGSASVAAITSWHAQIVRIPLNEDCWLGINGTPAATSGARYRAAIAAYTHLLLARGIDVILDLHWAAPAASWARGDARMPDDSHSGAFWAGVATAYANRVGVSFELFNEPYGVSWDCWQYGCDLPAGPTSPAYRALGMQTLLDIVRSVGASNPVIVDGLDKASNFSGWAGHRLHDSDHDVIAGWHIYGPYPCTTACWTSTVDRIAPNPVMVTELGETDCGSAFATTAMEWLDSRRISYLAWAWDPWPSCGGPPLIANWAGTPANSYGRSVRAELTRRG